MGLESERAGNGERESPRNSGRLTFYKTAVLSQVLVLSISAAPPPLFFCISHYLVPWDREQDGVSVLMWQEAILHSQRKKKKACDPFRAEHS